MPIEALLLEGKPTPFLFCPKCHEPFEPFLRGQVVRFSWFGLRKRIWCLICRACKEIVGYETAPAHPQTTKEDER